MSSGKTWRIVANCGELWRIFWISRSRAPQTPVRRLDIGSLMGHERNGPIPYTPHPLKQRALPSDLSRPTKARLHWPWRLRGRRLGRNHGYTVRQDGCLPSRRWRGPCTSLICCASPAASMHGRLCRSWASWSPAQWLFSTAESPSKDPTTVLRAAGVQKAGRGWMLRRLPRGPRFAHWRGSLSGGLTSRRSSTAALNSLSDCASTDRMWRDRPQRFDELH